VKNLT